MGEGLTRRRLKERCADILKEAAEVGPVKSVGLKHALLDKEVRSLLLNSKQRAGRNVDGKKWSTGLYKSLLECRFWRRFLRTDKARQKSSPMLRTLSRNLGWPGVPLVPDEEAAKRWVTARKTLTKYNSEDGKSRQKHLEECRNEAELEGDTRKVQEIKRIIWAESTH